MGCKYFFACSIMLFLSIVIYCADSRLKSFDAIFQGKKLNITPDNFGNLTGKFLNNSTVIVSEGARPGERLADFKDAGGRAWQQGRASHFANAKNLQSAPSRLAYLGKFIRLKNLKASSAGRVPNIKHKKYYLFANSSDFNKINNYLNDTQAQ